MGTYTKNYKMYKPAKTDYYNVEKDQNANFDILDTELKKVSDKATNLADTKEDKFSKKSGFNLDKTDNFINDTNKLLTSKAGYNLKNQVDNKVSKNGDTMTWMLDIDSNADRKVRAFRNGEEKGSFCGFTNAVGIHNASADKSMKIYDDGSVEILCNNLKTKASEVITAINELVDGKENAFDKKSGFNLDKTDNFINDTNKLLTSKAGYNLKNQVDNKVSKNGDTMTWMLDIDSNADRKVRAFRNGEEKGSFCGFTNAVGIHNASADKSMKIYDDGSVEILCNNLKTKASEVIAAINEVNNKIYEIEVARADIGKLGNNGSKRVQFKKVFKEIPIVILSSMTATIGGGTEGARAIDVDRSGFTLDSQWESFTQGYIEYIAIVSK